MRTKFWENIAYIALALCVFGNIAVGWFFLLAQTAYLIANGINVARDFALGRPAADKVRNLTFFAITVGLIIIRVFG